MKSIREMFNVNSSKFKKCSFVTVATAWYLAKGKRFGNTVVSPSFIRPSGTRYEGNIGVVVLILLGQK